MKILINPVAAPRMTRRDRWMKRPCVMRYFAFRDELLKKSSGYTLKDEISLIFGIPMPKSWSKKKKERMNLMPHQQKPDLDNLIKAFKDTFGDDAHVHTYGIMRKVWAHEGFVTIVEHPFNGSQSLIE